MLPMLLALAKHYDSFQIGTVMFVSGIFQFFSGPLAGFLDKKIDKRTMLFIGLIGFGTSTMLNGFLAPDFGHYELFWPQAMRGLLMMLCFLPMTSISLGLLSPEEVKNASGLYNLMRNLGGAVGIAVIDTYFTNRIKVHNSFLSDSLNVEKIAMLPKNQVMLDRLAGLLADPNDLEALNLYFMQAKINLQSIVLASNDVFIHVGLYILCCSSLIFLVKPVKPAQGMDSGH
jgi:DHA2 family multidrug resistance protein